MTIEDPLAEPGLYDGTSLPWIPPRVYHANARVSRSQLLLAKKCPLKLRHAMDNPDARTVTPDMIQGDALHAAIQEPDRFLEDYRMEPQVDGSTGHGRKVLRAFREKHAGKTIVPKAKSLNLLGMAMRVRKHPKLSPILQGPGSVEATAAWDDPVSGLRMRARVDRLYDTGEGPTALDLKKVQDASEEGFARQLRFDVLYLQAAMYLEGLTQATGVEHRRFGFVCIEEEPPHAVGIHWMSEEYLQVGRKLYHDLIDRVRQCKALGTWPDYAELGISVMYPPASLTG